MICRFKSKYTCVILPCHHHRIKKLAKICHWCTQWLMKVSKPRVSANKITAFLEPPRCRENILNKFLLSKPVTLKVSLMFSPRASNYIVVSVFFQMLLYFAAYSCKRLIFVEFYSVSVSDGLQEAYSRPQTTWNIRQFWCLLAGIDTWATTQMG